MPQQTKIFRVFVSSTFTDMKEERRILQKDVFPKLEKFCETNGAKFQAVDLRWGVNEETQLNQKTLEICLNEVARCQRISPKPNFIILLGNKYGWQPLPSKIPEDEMRQIQEVLADDEKSLINKWYWVDDNAIPSEYVLQSRGIEHEEYNVWKKIEADIQSILRKAVSSSTLSSDKKVKYFASATHQEIMRGTLNPPEDVKEPEEHVFAFIRNIKGLPADNSAKDFIDLNSDEKQDKYCADRIENLQTELKKKLGDHYVPYSASWENGKSNIDDPDKFSKDAYNFLEAVINDQLKDTISPNEIEHEVKLHKEFKERLTEYFHGRDEILEKIQQYLSNTSEKKVLCLIGDSGSGKSSVMAQAIKLNENSNAFIAYRFIGTTSRSSNITSLLLSLCGQVAKEYSVTLESLAGKGKEKSLYDINGLTGVFRKCLALGTPEKPITIFLDALDQLSDSGNARSLYWIPKELPDHARVIVSFLTELEKYLSGTNIEHLPVLPEAEARQIVNRWCGAAKRKLTEIQYKIVIDNFNKTGLPIYLKLAFERAKQWHSYDKNLTLKDDVKGIINDYFDWLENEHTEEFVRNVICYMLCGRYQGLAENEILEILVFDKEYWELFLNRSHEVHRKELDGVTKIPIVVWSRLFLDLEPFLTERDADGVPIITFFHQQFKEILKERYELSDLQKEHLVSKRVVIHTSLANYFHPRSDMFELINWDNCSNRILSELPFQMLHSDEPKRVTNLLCNPLFIGASIKGGLLNNITEDLNFSVEKQD